MSKSNDGSYNFTLWVLPSCVLKSSFDDNGDLNRLGEVGMRAVEDPQSVNPEVKCDSLHEVMDCGGSSIPYETNHGASPYDPL